MAKEEWKIDEKRLTKGEVRKLNALRKSVGDELGDEVFAKWYAQKDQANGVGDPNVQLVQDVLWPLVRDKKLRIPKSGYAVKRGRGRVIVEELA